MAAKDLGPLDWRMSITDKSGRPSPEFQRHWDLQRANNGLIGITFGSGPPTGIPVTDGVEYADTIPDPFVLYVGYNGAWQRISPIGANPTAIGGDVAVNGTSTDFMRSDASPAIQKTSSTVFGLAKVNNTTIAATTGVISVILGGTNGKIQYNNAGIFGGFTVSGDGTLIPSTGILTVFTLNGISPGPFYNGTDAANLTGTVSVNRFNSGTSASTSTFLRGDGTWVAPSAGASGANPTATAGDVAINGVATSFMRSDAAPAIQKTSSSIFGLAKVDGTTITAVGGVISAAASLTPANPTATGSDTATNGVAATYMRSDASFAIQKTSASLFGLAKVDGTTITAAAGVITAVTPAPRVSSVASITSPLAWNSDNFDEYCATAQAGALTINADAGTPVDGRKIIFRLKDNGTARALTWTTGSAKAFRVVGVTLPTTTVINKTVYVGCIYNAADSRWDAVAVSQEV